MNSLQQVLTLVRGAEIPDEVKAELIRNVVVMQREIFDLDGLDAADFLSIGQDISMTLSQFADRLPSIPGYPARSSANRRLLAMLLDVASSTGSLEGLSRLQERHGR
jgi:hypothetical protein